MWQTAGTFEFIRSNKLLKCFKLWAVFSHATSSKEWNSLLEVVWKNTVYENASYNNDWYKRDEVSALYCM